MECVSEEHAAKITARAPVGAAGPGTLAWGPLPARLGTPSASPGQLGARAPRPREKPIHAKGGRAGNTCPSRLSSGTQMPASESWVVKRNRKHLSCGPAGGQKRILRRNVNTAVVSKLQRFTLSHALFYV